MVHLRLHNYSASQNVLPAFEGESRLLYASSRRSHREKEQGGAEFKARVGLLILNNNQS